MDNWSSFTDESKVRWDENAEFWAEKMGPNSNSFHLEIIRPATEKLLSPKPGQRILDISCGDGNFSRRLTEIGAEVLAFDFSAKLIEQAKKRSEELGTLVDYHVLDATDEEGLLALGKGQFDSAVANMALMDISDLTALAKTLPLLLKPGGKFVFSVSHPCFQTPQSVLLHEEWEVGNEVKSRSAVRTTKYIQPEMHEGVAIHLQPVPQLYFHRPLSTLLSAFFETGFVLDGIEEPVFAVDEAKKRRFQWTEIPPAMIVSLRNLS